MRLYRGIKERYQPGRIPLAGTDFTDCPFTALQYAKGPKGVLIVVCTPEDAGARVMEGDWFDGRARRFLIFGSFDGWIEAMIPAKEARAEALTRIPPGSAHEK